MQALDKYVVDVDVEASSEFRPTHSRTYCKYRVYVDGWSVLHLGGLARSLPMHCCSVRISSLLVGSVLPLVVVKSGYILVPVVAINIVVMLCVVVVVDWLYLRSIALLSACCSTRRVWDAGGCPDSDARRKRDFPGSFWNFARPFPFGFLALFFTPLREARVLFSSRFQPERCLDENSFTHFGFPSLFFPQTSQLFGAKFSL